MLTTPDLRNVYLAELPLSVFRCPSQILPEHQRDLSSWNWIVMELRPRVVHRHASGLLVNQNRADANGILMGSLDGVLFAQSRVAIKHIIDGTSNTMLVGEAVHDIEAQTRITNREQGVGSRKDHWVMGSDDIDGTGGPTEARDLSEGMGSLGVPINYQNGRLGTEVCASSVASGAECQQFQLAFGSTHAGIAQFAKCDGSVDVVNDSIDALVARDLGTRDGEIQLESTQKP